MTSTLYTERQITEAFDRAKQGARSVSITKVKSLGPFIFKMTTRPHKITRRRLSRTERML
jgi:hypothetical protein